MQKVISKKEAKRRQAQRIAALREQGTEFVEEPIVKQFALRKNGPCPIHPEHKFKKCPNGCYDRFTGRSSVVAVPEIVRSINAGFTGKSLPVSTATETVEECTTPQ